MEQKIFKIGDKVWIRKDLIINETYDGTSFKINPYEKDIRGKEIKITDIDKGENYIRYHCKNYSTINPVMIDWEKMEQLQEPHYEIY